MAQYLGSGRKDRCAITVTQALLIAVAAYPLILTACPLGHLFFNIMKIPAEQVGFQRQYFDVLLYGVIFGKLGAPALGVSGAAIGTIMAASGHIAPVSGPESAETSDADRTRLK